MTNISITINDKHNFKSSDSYQPRPRAVIAVFPFKIRPIYPSIIIEQEEKFSFPDYLDLRNRIIIIVDDILSLNIQTSKGAPSHTMQAILAPLGDRTDYLQKMAPGDHVMSWIVNGDSALEALVDKLQNAQSANDYDSGLKFVGQVMSVQESFKVASSGHKTVRFTVNATGFNQYNAQIYYSPFLAPKDSTNEAQQLFVKNFYKGLKGNVIDNIVGKSKGGPLNIQKQLKFLHQTLLGPGPGVQSEILKTANDAYAIPNEVAKVLGRNIPNKLASFASISSVILGIQEYDPNSGGPLGPDFKLSDFETDSSGNPLGSYWEPKNLDTYSLQGRKALRISPTMGGTVYSLLQQVSNPAINEMYFTLRPEPNEDAKILPTMVCRQLPFVTNPIETFSDFPYTKYLDMPRFLIPSESIMSYDLSRNDALRLNCTMVRMQAAQGKQQLQNFVDVLAMQNGNWALDSSDIKRMGLRFYPVQIDQDIVVLDDVKAKDVIRKYTAFISSIITNQHLKYNGTIQTFGIFDPICVGENLEFNDIVFHIESVNHVYQVQNGLPIFRTTLSLSHGIHKSGDLEALQEEKNYKFFKNMHGGIIKDQKYKTILVSTSGINLADDNQAANPNPTITGTIA